MGGLRPAWVVAIVIAAVAVVLPASAGRSAVQAKIFLPPDLTGKGAVAAPVAISGSARLSISGVIKGSSAFGQAVCEYDAFFVRCGADKWPSQPGDSIEVGPSPQGPWKFLRSVIDEQPSFRDGHDYVVTLRWTGVPYFSANPHGDVKDYPGPWSGQFTLDFGGTPTRGGNTLKATLGSITGDVSIRRPGGGFVDATGGEQLQPGDDISTGPDSSATLTLSDGSVVTVQPNTQINLGSLIRQKNSVRVRLNLRIGAVAAKVNKSQTEITDYSVKTPTATGASRGTRFSVFYDPGSRATLVRVTQHSVSVAPAFGGKPILVPAGKEVEVTAHTITRPTVIGKADASGGIDRETAWSRVQTVLGRETRACGLRSTHSGVGSSVQPVPGGWRVTLTVNGAVHGASVWQVAGSKVAAVNALAKTIAAGCPGAAPPDLTGNWQNKADPSSPAWHLKTSNNLKTLDATWTGGAGHTSLQGSFHGTLAKLNGAYVYQGTFQVTEGSTQVNGTASFKIDNANQIEITLQPTGGTPSHYTFIRVSG